MDLVFQNKESIVTNSLLVAEKFGKDHKHVLDAIRDLLRTAENSALLFNEGSKLSHQNHSLKLIVNPVKYIQKNII